MNTKKESSSFLYLAAFMLLLLMAPATLNAQSNAAGKQVFDVLKYGAKGDGVTFDSPGIQKAIDEATKAGNGAQVLIPGGHRYLVGTIQLKSDIDFHLDGDAELYVSTNPKDYINDAVIIANDVKNLKISGTGSINGRALEFMTHYSKETEIYIPATWRPKIFILTKCKNLDIRDITFGSAPNWGLHMLGCEDVVIDNIKIRNNLEVPNCDGIDPDHCRNVVIRNCNIVCGDDAVVIKSTRQPINYGLSKNIRVQDCYMVTQDAGLKIGTETTEDIQDITFERCKIKTSSRGICIQLRDEGNIFNITFRDIEFESRFYSDPWWGRGEGISFTAVPRTPESKIGTIHDIKLINIKGTCENSVILRGTKESRISNITFDNVALTLNKLSRYKGGLVDNRPTSAYPPIEEQKTSAFNFRFVDNILLKKCSVKWGENKPDYYTNAINATNATGVKVEQFSGVSANPKLYPAISISKK
jgi:polygalacturonase